MPASGSAYDCYLTVGSVRRGLIISEDNGTKQYQVGLAPTLAPQQRLNADNLYEGQPPEVSVTYSSEAWHGGAGTVDAPSMGHATDAHASNGYNHSQNVDLSEEHRVYLSPKRQTTLTTTGAAIVGNPIQYLETSLGLFMITDERIYEWDISSLSWVQVSIKVNIAHV
jgi:hypothetical protein